MSQQSWPAQAGKFWLTILCLVFTTGITSWPSRAVAQAPPPVTNLDVVMVIDQSSSMWQRNDPQVTATDGSIKNPGWRIVAAHLLAEWLATDQSGARHQLAVIMFGAEAKTVYPLQEIQSDKARAAFGQAITENDKDMGGTDILAALRLAKDELNKAASTSNTRKLVIFLSDGVCDVAARSTEQCNQDIRQYIQTDFTDKAGIPIDTIALTSDAFKQDPGNKIYKNLWQEIATTTGGDYYEPVQAERELLDAFVRILQHLFGLPIQSPPAPADAPLESSYTLPDDLLQVGFTIIKYDPSITMVVQRPDGSDVKTNDAGVQYSKSELTENLNISRPPKGVWHVKIGGVGKVVLIVTPFAKNQFVIERQIPAAVHPQGKPMQIQVRVLDVDRVEKMPQELKLDVVLPDGKPLSLGFTAQGTLYSTLLTDTSQIGNYTFRYRGRMDATGLDASQVVRVVTSPWLQVLQPTPDRVYPNNQPLPVQVQVMLGNQPMLQHDAADRLEVLARLRGLNAQEVDAQFLQPAAGAIGMAGAIYSGTIKPNGDGIFNTNLQLLFTSAHGEKYEDLTDASFTVRGAAPAPTPDKPALIPTTIPQQETSNTVPLIDPNLQKPALIALGAVVLLIILAVLYLVHLLRSIRNATLHSVNQQDLALQTARERETGLLLKSEDGWRAVAEQVIADATGIPVSIDQGAGVLDVTAEPHPKFTVITRNGQQIILTTDPASLRKMKLIRRGDRVVDASKVSRISHFDAGLLWKSILEKRNVPRVTPPLSAHWYVVVRTLGGRSRAGSRWVGRRLSLSRKGRNG